MTKQLLMAVAVSAVALTVPTADVTAARPLVVVDPTGSVRIQQELPCGDALDITRSITGGRIEVVFAGNRIPPTFSMTKLDVFLAPFSVRRQCRGIEANAEFYEIGLRLASAVTFDGVPDGAESMRYSFQIPAAKFLLYKTVLDNAPVPQPEHSYDKPAEDVTGVLDLRSKTIEIHVGLASRMRFRAGCVGPRCAIDEERPGAQTADVAGVIGAPNADTDEDGIPDVVDNCPGTANPAQGPDTTPPTAMCQAVTSLTKSFRVSATDGCSRRVALRIGPYMLENGDVIRIQETGQQGVRQLPGDKQTRFFQVGKGQAFITATDAAGNSANAACR